MSEETREDDRQGRPRPRELIELADRCAAANIQVEWGELVADETPYLYIQMPNGRTTRRIFVTEEGRRHTRLREVDFTKYTFIGDYEAIASYTDRYIEAGLTGSAALKRLLRSLPGVERISADAKEGLAKGHAVESDLPDADAADDAEPDAEDQADLQLSIEGPETSWRLELSPASSEFSALSRPVFTGATRAMTLKMRNANFGTHEIALQLLEDVLGSFLFELELRYDLGISLQRIRIRRPRAIRRKAGAYPGPVQLPRTRYPREPLELYWYAKSALGMPLLQYLAYYQAIEFFFSLHSRSEALTRLRNELRDPRFNLEVDSDLGRILSLATVSGGGFGTEREQLKATLRACLDRDRLREFLTEELKNLEHFTGKQQIAGVQRLDLNDRQADLRDQVASRVYDLRCRIVHTKDEPGPRVVGLLLPFSKEADLLAHDIVLIKHICQKVLIAGGSAMRLPM